jgi:nucleotide-binding universal stress UspA family protein
MVDRKPLSVDRPQGASAQAVVDCSGKERRMSVMTICLAMIAERETVATGAIDYAVAFAEQERAHLSCRIAPPEVNLPSARVLPMVRALVEQVNAERLAAAQALRAKVETAARLAGVPVDCEILSDHYLEAREKVVAGARASDYVVLPQAGGALSAETGLIEGVLFGCGRPAIVVPRQWTMGATAKRIVVAWDGGARAARAVGDAMPLLARADDVEVVCITDGAAGDLAGSDIARHLARQCRQLRLLDLPIAHDDAGRTLSEHLASAPADLLVMGAFAHSRLFQLVLGGVTSSMLETARLPVLYSY